MGEKKENTKRRGGDKFLRGSLTGCKRRGEKLRNLEEEWFHSLRGYLLMLGRGGRHREIRVWKLKKFNFWSRAGATEGLRRRLGCA